MKSIDKDKVNEPANESIGVLDGPPNLSTGMPTNSEDINEVTATSTKESPKYEDKIKANVDLRVDYSSSFVSCRCSCAVLAAELEGVKLDIVILQKIMDLQVNSTTERISRRKRKIKTARSGPSSDRERAEQRS